jgi:hypothetical protein
MLKPVLSPLKSLENLFFMAYFVVPPTRVEKSREHPKHARGTLRDFPGTLKPQNNASCFTFALFD